MSDRVTINVDERGIADVRMNRPEKRNALDTAMFTGLRDAGEQLKAMPNVRVVVLSGEGSSFCAGLDFSSFNAMASGERGGGSETPAASDESPSTPTTGGITHLGQQVAWVWQELPVPVIAAVHGHALGGGIQIALGADIRIVHPATQLSVREVHWGLVPDMTGTLFLSQLCGVDVAKELTFTARIFSGTEAGELGVATHVSETPREDALALAAEIAGRSPEAVRGAKALFNRLANQGAAEQFAEERRVIGSLIGTPNQVETVKANFEKRAPSYTDPG
ncbi:MAG TPA: crotonase/enoyl-CoA hydratase family protein [Ilumatobacteraceae bacterium]|nr:crotonase/enoyl-CoA hydratase family protein [Ilumatobacteraceae bacterium]